MYNIQIQIFLKYHLQKCTLLSLQELKSHDIVSISTLSALISIMIWMKLYFSGTKGREAKYMY